MSHCEVCVHCTILHSQIHLNEFDGVELDDCRDDLVIGVNPEEEAEVLGDFAEEEDQYKQVRWSAGQGTCTNEPTTAAENQLLLFLSKTQKCNPDGVTRQAVYISHRIIFVEFLSRTHSRPWICSLVNSLPPKSPLFDTVSGFVPSYKNVELVFVHFGSCLKNVRKS